MIYILMILVGSNIYLFLRLFYIKNNIKSATSDLKEILNTEDTNRKLKLKSPDRGMEKLLNQININLQKLQDDKIKFMKRELNIRKEIENISHDLRTPLTSIRGYLEFIKEDNIDRNTFDKYVNIVDRRAKGLQNLIQEFYDLSRLEADEYKFNMEYIDINKELRENIINYYNDFEEKNINVDISLPEKCVNLECDKDVMIRVFSNLISNAKKYSKSTFSVSLNEDNKTITITFENDNDDLEDKDISMLFERFYMNDKSRHSGSSGLGLTVTKLLVKKMNGNIEVNKNKNMISFYIIFNK